MYFCGKEKRDSDEKSAGCGILVKKERERGIKTPLPPDPIKQGNIREYSPTFKTARVAKKIWRIINTIVSIWGENMLGHSSLGMLGIICSS